MDPEKGCSYRKKQKEKMVKSQITDISHLPSELVFNILSRLPLTSLLGSAKCTCKLWHSVINDPVFPDLHFSHALNNPPGYLYAHSSNNLYFTDNPTLALKLPGDLGDKWKYTSIASCRGLISYWHTWNKSIYLCNPILGDQVKIPSPNLPVFAWGFGYAPLAKQYKYIYFSSPNPHSDNPIPHAAKIFTLGDQSWRDLAVPHNYAGCKSVYCNGAFYWNFTTATVSEYCFMSLDLDTENFRLRRLPIVTGDYLISTLYPTVFGKTVAIVIQTRDRIQEVWMQVDEAEDIWIKKYSIAILAPRIPIIASFTPSGLWMNQDLFGWEYFIRGPGNLGCELCERWLLYNVDSKIYTKMQLPLAEDADTKADDGAPRLVITHVGSLVSPLKIAKAAVNPTSW